MKRSENVCHKLTFDLCVKVAFLSEIKLNILYDPEILAGYHFGILMYAIPTNKHISPLIMCKAPVGLDGTHCQNGSSALGSCDQLSPEPSHMFCRK